MKLQNQNGTCGFVLDGTAALNLQFHYQSISTTVCRMNKKVLFQLAFIMAVGLSVVLPQTTGNVPLIVKTVVGLTEKKYRSFCV